MIILCDLYHNNTKLLASFSEQYVLNFTAFRIGKEYRIDYHLPQRTHTTEIKITSADKKLSDIAQTIPSESKIFVIGIFGLPFESPLDYIRTAGFQKPDEIYTLKTITFKNHPENIKQVFYISTKGN